MGRYLMLADMALAERPSGHKVMPMASGPKADQGPAGGDEVPMAVYTVTECHLLADASSSMRATVDGIKREFVDWCGVEVVACGLDPTWSPRRHAARVIREARRVGDRDRAVSLRDGWRERVAICMIDGGLSEREAEQVAVGEVRR